MSFIRSTLFNILFFGATGLACVLCLPGLLLPKRKAMRIVRAFVNSVYWLEKHILGLDYEVRGLEHLPRHGSYIIAAKHESAYETMKLHRLFADPAVVLKQELLNIPLWGRFLAKTQPIAIDRSAGKQALEQIIDGALAIQSQERAIVIFPQGTRVSPDTTTAEKPYRIGVARMSERTGMPIIPMALNSGVFWGKHQWGKRGGRAVFEFLPPVASGLGVYEIMRDLETRLETASSGLRDEARNKP